MERIPTLKEYIEENPQYKLNETGYDVAIEDYNREYEKPKRKRIKRATFSSRNVKKNVSYCLSTWSLDRMYQNRKKNTFAFNHMIWSWKYRLLPDNTIRWRIVT